MSIHPGRHELEMELEKLEDRRLLAGNVEVFVTGGGDLIINGDDNSNDLVIQTVSPGEFRINSSDTTINGSTDALTLSGVTDDVRINLRNGNNGIIFENTTIPDRLTIRTGNGGDAILFNSGDTIHVGSDLRINSGSGSDTVSDVGDGHARLNVGDDLSVTTRSGGDTVSIALAITGDRFTVNTGDGDDSVTLGVPASHGIAAGAGGLSISTGNGSDDVELLGMVFRDRANVKTGSGSDQLQLTSVFVADRMSISMGGDGDHLEMFGDPSGNVRATGNGGFDTYRGPEISELISFEGIAA